MKAIESHSRRRVIQLAVPLCFILLIVASLCFLSVRQYRSLMRSETNRYLGEVSDQVTEMVDYRIEANYQSLSVAANTYRQIELPKNVPIYLQSVVDQLDYHWIGVYAGDQLQYATSPTELNLTGETFFQAALAGERAVSGLRFSPLDGSEAIYYAVPLGGGTPGVLAGCITIDRMREFLQVNSFGGEGVCQIVDHNGDFVIRSQNANFPATGSNFFALVQQAGQADPGYSLETVRRDMAQNRTGRLYFSLGDGVHRVMTYSPLAEKGWYLFSIVPSHVTGKQMTSFLHFSILINVVIVLLFGGLVTLLVLSYHHSQGRLERLAFVDPVTGGANLARFEAEARALIQNAAAGTYALVSLDIRNFKLINGSFGSAAGNDTLRHVYNVIQSHLGLEERIGRANADNFSILLKNEPPARIAERLSHIAEEMNRFNDGLASKYYLPVCEGVYIIDDPALDMITIRDRANTARKNSPRVRSDRLSSCSFYAAKERDRLLREKEIENRMESALESREFVVYLQPKIAPDSNRISGAEALARWQDPERGLVSPGDFIPLFEQNGFIVKLDLFIFEEVCGLLQKWRAEGRELFPVSFNLSRAHLRDPNFLQAFQAVFTRYDIPAGLIEFELTETLVFENPEVLIGVIEQIHSLGFTCALDDFGSGYSSLNTLKDIPVDVLKLDGAFFHGADGNRAKAVVDMVISLARKLHMRTVAEGVETLPQVEFLCAAHCDMVQGFVFSRPLPVPEFEEFAFPSPKDRAGS